MGEALHQRRLAVVAAVEIKLNTSAGAAEVFEGDAGEGFGGGADDFHLAEDLGGAGAVELRLDHLRIQGEGAFGAFEGFEVAAHLAVHAGEVGPAELVAGIEFHGLGHALGAFGGTAQGIK